MAELNQQLSTNLASVRERIAAAAERSGRTPADVSLVAVCKYVSSDLTAAMAEAGCLEIGESRPQQLWTKFETLKSLPIQWHMIGHLQRNKVKRTIEQVSLLHSGNSLRLLNAVNIAAGEAARQLPILLQVNISREPNKHGFNPETLASHLPEIGSLQHIQVRGLMTMATLDGGEAQARHDFCQLRELRDTLRAQCPPSIHLHELSMGMSGDFEIAIEEGATIVRVGSALFDGVNRD